MSIIDTWLDFNSNNTDTYNWLDLILLRLNQGKDHYVTRTTVLAPTP